ncbi:MAG TPA: chorismate-binding protein, partial [Patescibacteria group bacterium]|nr:chorismate-binding protein [Patescibacteria group bacterium]
MKKLPKLVLGQKPIYRKIAEDLDFFALFQKIEQQFDTCFLFESLGEEGTFARYSIIGFDPKHLISARKKILVIDGKSYEVENPYASLQEIMPRQTIARDYAGGLVGYLNYDAVNYFEPSVSVKIHKDFDQFLFGFYTDGLVFDKLTNELFYFFYDDNRESLVKDILVSKLKKRDKLEVTFLKNSLTKKEFINDVEKVKEHIVSGNTFQCEVGFKSFYKTTGDIVKIYERLREMNPSPFMYYVKFGEKKIIGASPELLFSLRDGELTTRPLAGTITRGKSEKEDKKLARILLTDPKERAEHTMLVDLHRNDIGR